MSLRYGHLFDTTVRTEYERALNQAKNRIGTIPAPPAATPETSSTSLAGATIKTALAAGY